MLRGGDDGPAIVPGHPEQSLLIKAVRYTDPDLQMPPKNKKLSDAQIADLVTWVKMGAPDNRAVAKGATMGRSIQERRNFWSFKAIRRQPIPEVQDTNWVSNPVDNFILSRLEKNGLTPSAEADRTTLIRRLKFDETWMLRQVAIRKVARCHGGSQSSRVYGQEAGQTTSV